MSREEIDRILTHDIDSHLQQHLHAIDHITDTLALKSNFLAQFQLLLQQQLSQNPPIDHQQIHKENAAISKQQVVVQQAAETICEASAECDDNVEYGISVECPGSEQVVGQQKLQRKKDGCCVCNNGFAARLRKELSMCIGGVRQCKILYTQLLGTLKQIVFGCREQMISIAQHHINLITNQLQQQHNQRMQALLDQNSTLKPQIHSHSTPLKQLTFNHLSTDSINNKQQGNQGNTIPSQLQQQDVVYSTAVQPKLQSFPIKTKRHSRTTRDIIQHQITHRQQPYQYKQQPNSTQDPSITIPTIRPISIGVPPVRQGFGILKYNHRTIYKGMWSHGKFEGKGTLEWDNYSYVGQFKNGLFSGYGILQTQGITYTGRFQSNKAQGQGTVQLLQMKRYGVWRDNQLVREY